jgi:hypothetical protein
MESGQYRKPAVDLADGAVDREWEKVQAAAIGDQGDSLAKAARSAMALERVARSHLTLLQYSHLTLPQYSHQALLQDPLLFLELQAD